MYLIVGLGNPGKKYKKTRHNIGWLVLEHLLKKHGTRNTEHGTNFPRSGIPLRETKFKINKRLKSAVCNIKIGDQQVILARPLTYMNQSGEAVRLLINSTRPAQRDGFSSHLFVIHDDLDIPLGSFKIQFGKGPKEHKGIKSIEEALGTKGFWRVRIGVENRRLKARETGEEYVLGEFSPGEVKVLERVIPEVVERLMKHLRTS